MSYSYTVTNYSDEPMKTGIPSYRDAKRYAVAMADECNKVFTIYKAGSEVGEDVAPSYSPAGKLNQECRA